MAAWVEPSEFTVSVPIVDAIITEDDKCIDGLNADTSLTRTLIVGASF